MQRTPLAFIVPLAALGALGCWRNLRAAESETSRLDEVRAVESKPTLASGGVAMAATETQGRAGRRRCWPPAQ
jgi:hypothetical protein